MPGETGDWRSEVYSLSELASFALAASYKTTMTGIPTHKLGNVIAIDEAKGTVFVEPNVTMGQLTATIMPLGESSVSSVDQNPHHPATRLDLARATRAGRLDRWRTGLRRGD